MVNRTTDEVTASILFPVRLDAELRQLLGAATRVGLLSDRIRPIVLDVWR